LLNPEERFEFWSSLFDSLPFWGEIPFKLSDLSKILLSLEAGNFYDLIMSLLKTWLLS
jgi:hypothetical protein